MIPFDQYYKSRLLTEGLRETALSILCGLGLLSVGCSSPGRIYLGTPPWQIGQQQVKKYGKQQPGPVHTPKNLTTLTSQQTEELVQAMADYSEHNEEARNPNWDGWTEWIKVWISENIK